ncbi:MAG: ComF family protein [PVC group bacterium]
MPESLLWLLHFFFPKECVHCGRLLDYRNREYLCPACLPFLFLITGPVCGRCGRPLEGEVLPPAECSSCRKNPPPFRRARAAFLLRGAGKSLVLGYKYSRNPYLSAAAAERLHAVFSARYRRSDYDGVLAVPLHPRKARERGFNQSALLAAGLSRRTGIRLERKGLIRERYTGTQTRLSRKEREKNVRGAFRVVDPARFRDRSLLLIDDVHTTGATVSACAEVLMKAGAERVDVLTLARAV